MKFLSHDWCMSGHSTERSFAVSERKRLTLLVVCNLIHIVQDIPHVFFLLVHSISSGIWLAVFYLHGIALLKISQFSVRVSRGDIKCVLPDLNETLGVQ